ncbi:RNA dependent RNA polymerase-domain-containing protein [Mycena pura]|uniref:RNA-dependent RNA polymerase n=1 Tax=Mycena pura TaxID=153505 RepID=A0AAD6YIV6_9AGAR|nr:RNA dependent RNA polymerase-domain-containing protein [Mycena pura]
MAKVLINYLPTTADSFDVKVAIAGVLHSDDFRTFAKEAASLMNDIGSDPSSTRLLLNFEVELNQSTIGITRNNGTGTLSLPSGEVRTKFLDWVKQNPIRIAGKRVKLYRGPGIWEQQATILSRTLYIDPAIEREHQQKLEELHEALRVDVVQFGYYYREYPSQPIQNNQPIPPRKFSIEWEKHVAWLRFEYDHKRICIQLGDESTEYIGSNVILTFASISKIAVGFDPKPYVCFDTLTPPTLEGIKFHRTLSGDEIFDNKKSKTRIGSLEPGHLRVAPFAQQVRIVLYNDPNRNMIREFCDLCSKAGLPKTIIFSSPPLPVIDALRCNFFSAKRLHKLEIAFRKLDWAVAFQIEALLRNMLLNTEEIDYLLPQIDALCRKKGSTYTSRVLQEYNRSLYAKSLRESPVACFTRVLEQFVDHTLSLQDGAFNCCHVTVTPTRLLLEGPYPVQSNRIIRRYQQFGKQFEENFIRVSFRDEDRLQYRWARDVDGSSFVSERVGGILKEGLVLGGRRFEFLAYSTSALRGHAVWFMNPFKDQTGAWITSQDIRQDVGNFAGTPLLKCPSKYAARLAQAFTATDPSVKIDRNQWEEVPDLVVPGHDNDEKLHSKYVYTDGVGTISRKLAEWIWQALCKSRQKSMTNTLTPSAFQIRFLGYKGVVSVDEQLDHHPDGILMRLRPSMKKFDSDDLQAKNAEIEIAMAFERPLTACLNRPLVMALEDRGVRQAAFLKLQDLVVADARTIDDSISQFRSVLRDHSLGNPFRLSFLLEKLEKLGLDLRAKQRTPGIDNEFLRQLRQVAMNDVLREIKHSARIPIPESHLLVGVADEGPAYKRAGFENVYELQPGKIYACIQRPEDEDPTWLEGSCTISRSPIAHVGDVQRVQAIGKPPEGMLCSFAGLKNVVVLPSRSSPDLPRSLASCLGGGDLDVSSDMYSVIQYSSLLPTNQEKPASYPDGETLTLDRDSEVEDICNFIIEYINSDVLGLLSDRLLVIAGELPQYEGMHDKDCKRLAALCSQAVDYPKLGVPVDLDNNRLPSLLMRCKPDWHATDVVAPRETDYYRSEKALGDLYRAITLDDPEPISSDPGVVSNGSVVNDADVASNPISSTLLPLIESNLLDYISPDDTCVETKAMFRKYTDELRYVSVTHTLTTEPGVYLLEAEIVLGTILAKCTQRRWRSDCSYRMRYHTLAVLWPKEKESDATPESLQTGLKHAWKAWDFSLRHEKEFGAKSFGLIALGIIFDCLDLLSKGKM